MQHRIFLQLVLAIVFLLASFPLVAQAEDSVFSFQDVPLDHWSYSAVHEFHELGLTAGIGNNRFGLGQTIVRAEFIAFLNNLMQWPSSKNNMGSFADNQDPEMWYFNIIETAAEQGIIEPNLLSRPQEAITRKEMAVMLIKCLHYSSLAEQLAAYPNPFYDVTDQNGYISLAHGLGLVFGSSPTTFLPDHFATREEACAMLLRFYHKLEPKPSTWHGFYAISSYNQVDLFAKLNSVGFGWSRLEFDLATQNIHLNMSQDNHNPYGIPSDLLDLPQKTIQYQLKKQLLITVEDKLVDTPSNAPVSLTSYLIANSANREQTIRAIIDGLNKMDSLHPQLVFNGIIIDFENLKGMNNRSNLTQFLQELKAALPASIDLWVAVQPARPRGISYYDAYDFQAIGSIADYVILMAHDYQAKSLTQEEMRNGITTTPLAPLDQVYYALQTITDSKTGITDRNKILLQISFDAAQWKSINGQVINSTPYTPSYEAIYQRMLQNPVINYREDLASPYITYYNAEDGTDNIIWYEDARSVQAKINLAKMFGIHSFSLWRLGNIPNYPDSSGDGFFLDIVPLL